MKKTGKLACAAIVIVGCIAMAGISLMTGNDQKELQDENVIIHKYKGLEYEEPQMLRVTDAYIDDMIQGQFQEHQKITSKSVNRKIKDGDVVVFEGKCMVGDLEFWETDDYTLLLGEELFPKASGKYKSFQEQLIGLKKGDKAKIIVKLPDVGKPEFNNKKAVYSIKIKDVKEVVYHELNEDVPDFFLEGQTYEELHKKYKESMLESCKEQKYVIIKNNVLTALLNEIELKNPKEKEKEIKERAKEMKKYYEQTASSEDNLLEDKGELSDESLQMSAIRDLKMKYAFDLIQKKEHLTLNNRKFKEKVYSFAVEQGFDKKEHLLEMGVPENFKFSETGNEKNDIYNNMINLYGEESLRASMQDEVIFDFLIENAVPKKSEAEKSTESSTESSTSVDKKN